MYYLEKIVKHVQKLRLYEYCMMQVYTPHLSRLDTLEQSNLSTCKMQNLL
jgi:hypothetical protein